MTALVDSVCCGNDTAKAIAEKYGLHPSFLSNCRRAVGLPKCQRGRRALIHPTLEHQRILDLVRTDGISGTARKVGLSKQRVFSLVKRWTPGLKGLRPPSKTVSSPRRNHSPRRMVVVSFRLSSDEWNQLLTLRTVAGGQNMSGCQVARAILLHHISQRTTMDQEGQKQGCEDMG
jgi:hypothetical protein